MRVRFILAVAAASLFAYSGVQSAQALTLDPTPPANPTEVLYDDTELRTFQGTGEHGDGGDPEGLDGASVRGFFEFASSADGGYFSFAMNNNGSGSDAGAISRAGFFFPDAFDITGYTLTLYQVTSSNDCWATFGTCVGTDTAFSYTLYNWHVSSGINELGFPVPGPNVIVDFGASADNLGNGGIQVGDYGAFVLAFTGGSSILASTSDFQGQNGEFWCVRWQGGDEANNVNGDSDAACGSGVPVPEPGSLGLLGVGLIALGAVYRRRLWA